MVTFRPSAEENNHVLHQSDTALTQVFLGGQKSIPASNTVSRFRLLGSKLTNWVESGGEIFVGLEDSHRQVSVFGCAMEKEESRCSQLWSQALLGQGFMQVGILKQTFWVKAMCKITVCCSSIHKSTLCRYDASIIYTPKAFQFKGQVTVVGFQEAESIYSTSISFPGSK